MSCFAGLSSCFGGIPSGTYTVYYHTKCQGFWGRALHIGLMLEEAGVKVDFKDGADFPGKGFAPPMVASPSGAKIAQTAAISIVLGKELGFTPADSAAHAKACQLVEDFNDLFTEVSGNKDDDRIKKWLQHLEDNLTAKYFCGDSASFADFHGIMVFTGVSQMKASLMAGYPKLCAWIKTMTALKSYQKLKAGGVAFLPEQYGGLKLL